MRTRGAGQMTLTLTIALSVTTPGVTPSPHVLYPARSPICVCLDIA